MSFTTLGAWLTSFLSGYVHSVVAVLAGALAPLALIWLTVYIANYGYAVARGEVQEPIGVFGWKMIKMGFTLAFALGVGWYLDVIAKSIEGLQDGMATVFISGGSGSPYDKSAPGTAWGALDKAMNTASALLADLWKEAGITRLDLYAAGILFTLAMDFLLLIGAAVTLMSKMFMAFALAIGPAAILCLMFKPSAKYFDAWLSVAMASVVLSWFVFFALGLALFINEEIVKGITASGAFAASGTPGATMSAMHAAGVSVVMYGLLGLLLWQAPSLASALTGGPSLRGGAGMAVSYAAGRLGGGGRGAGSSGASSSGGRGNSVAAGAGVAYSAGAATGGAARMAYQQVSRVFSSGPR